MCVSPSAADRYLVLTCSNVCVWLSCSNVFVCLSCSNVFAWLSCSNVCTRVYSAPGSHTQNMNNTHTY